MRSVRFPWIGPAAAPAPDASPPPRGDDALTTPFASETSPACKMPADPLTLPRPCSNWAEFWFYYVPIY